MMDEYIKREDAIKHLRGACIAKYPLSFSYGIFASADEISKLPTADVVPKSDVAQILENNQMCLEIIETQDQTIQIAKANIARLQTLPRKIFEEIERLLAVYSYTDEYGKEVIGVDVEELIAELKNKYTEQKND
jgi:hypothetical protein